MTLDRGNTHFASAALLLASFPLWALMPSPPIYASIQEREVGHSDLVVSDARKSVRFRHSPEYDNSASKGQEYDYEQSDALQQTALSIAVFVASDILFPFDSARINEAGVSELNRLTAELLKYSHLTLVCFGHTDSVGSEAYNRQLGLRRAQAVKRRLVEGGVPEERVNVQSLGENQPAVPNDTRANRAKNRRVEFKFFEQSNVSVDQNPSSTSKKSRRGRSSSGTYQIES